MKLIELARLSETEARERLEAILWPNGPVCPHCKKSEKVYRLEGETNRKGLLKCSECREPFTVTVGTVMESSHVPLVKWLVAFHLMASSKKGFSAHQLHRTIGVTYKTAWFMAHRIRYAMNQADFTPLSRIVEVDETYVGGKPRKIAGLGSPERAARADRKYTEKTPVLALVERGGNARVMPLERVRGRELKAIMKAKIAKDARIMTDESPNYRGTDKHFASHETVNHSAYEYSRGDVTTNDAESFFALVKRQRYGTNHQYSKKHTAAYLTETEFRWNTRKVSDEARTDQAVRGIKGKRLMYKQSC